jgi:hypothetical protein
VGEGIERQRRGRVPRDHGDVMCGW